MSVVILPLTLALAAAITFVQEARSRKISMRKCVFCKEDSFIINRGICSNCLKDEFGETRSAAELATAIDLTEKEKRKRKIISRTMFFLFLSMALMALLFTLFKIFN